MSASLIATHRTDGAAIPDNSTVVAALSGVLLSTTQSHAWRVRGTSDVTVSHLRTYVVANTTVVTSTFTVRKNGTNQSLAVTYTSGQTGEKQDTTNSFSASAGDDVDIGLVVANDVSGAKTITVHSITAVFTPSTTGDTVSRLGSRGAPLSLSTASVSRYMAGGSPSNATSTETERRIEILSSYTLSHLYTYVASNARTTTTTCRVRKNGANGNQSVSYTSGQTGVKEDTSNTDSVASGDDVDWSISTSTGTGTISLEAIDCVALSAADKFELMCGSSAVTLTNGATRYLPLVSLYNARTSEADSQARTLAATYTDMRAYISSNSGDGDTTFTFRVEGADTSLSITYTSGQTGLKTDTDTVAAADDDLISYKYVSTSTSGTVQGSWLAITGYTSGGLVTETGALASVADDAWAGTGVIIASGSLASANDDAFGGAGLAVAAGSIADDVPVGLTGSGVAVVAGALAADVDAADSGGGLALGAGALADDVDAGDAGAGVAVAAGSLATEDAAGLSGSGVAAGAGSLALDVDEALSGGALAVGTGSVGDDADAGIGGDGLAIGAGAVADDLVDAWSGLGAYIGLGSYADALDEALAGLDVEIGPEPPPSGWHATALVRPWTATGRPPTWGATVYVTRAWSATGRRL